MMKHVGPIIAWIIVVGIVLYIIRHYADLINGISVLQNVFDTGGAFNDLFKMQ